MVHFGPILVEKIWPDFASYHSVNFRTGTQGHIEVKLGLILSTLFVFIASMSEIFNFWFSGFSFLLSFCLLGHINVAFPLVYYEFF